MRGLLYSFPVKLMVLLGAIVAATTIVSMRVAFDMVRREMWERF